MRQGFRFHPPDLPVPPGVFWALQRAFSPLGSTVALTETPQERLLTANRLGLLPRISARQPQSVLEQELGTEAAQKLILRTRVQMAQGLAIEATQRQISAVAQSEHIPIVLLKFAALYAKKKVTVASRAACDLDILVTPKDVPRLTEKLIALGFSRLNLHSPAHQPVVLKSPSSVAIELHVHLPYVRTSEGGPFADLPNLQKAELLERYQPENVVVFLPKDELLIAHLIAHGIAQHGFEPKTYPLLRMVSDLFDLGVAITDSFDSQVFPLASTDVSREEVLALVQLAVILRESNIATGWKENDGASRMLRHFVLSALNEQYQAQVLFRRTVVGIEDVGLIAATREFLQYAFFLPDDHVRYLDNHPSRNVLLVRLMRPFKFAHRAVKRLVVALGKGR